jgi:hypothetical protein
VSEQPEAKQVPLLERLEAVPADARLAVNDGPFSTSFYPVGAMAHEAAAELRRRHAANSTLLSALQNIALYTSQTHPDKEVMAQVLDENARIARAAIKKAEGGKP